MNESTTTKAEYRLLWTRGLYMTHNPKVCSQINRAVTEIQYLRLFFLNQKKRDMLRDPGNKCWYQDYFCRNAEDWQADLSSKKPYLPEYHDWG